MIPNLIRTYVPWLVCWIVGALTWIGVNVTDEQQAMLVALISTIAGVLYHLLVRLLERRWPRLSVLLGSKEQPAYAQVSRDGKAYVITQAPTRDAQIVSDEPLALFPRQS